MLSKVKCISHYNQNQNDFFFLSCKDWKFLIKKNFDISSENDRFYSSNSKNPLRNVLAQLFPYFLMTHCLKHAFQTHFLRDLFLEKNKLRRIHLRQQHLKNSIFKKTIGYLFDLIMTTSLIFSISWKNSYPAFLLFFCKILNNK